jgi:hypothetical protein
MVSANQAPPKSSSYPDPDTLSKASRLVEGYKKHFKDEEERDKAFEHLVDVTENLGAFLKRVKDDASVDEDMEAIWDDVEYNAKEAHTMAKNAHGKATDSVVYDMAESLRKALDDAANLSNSLRNYETRKKQVDFRMEVAQNTGDNPLLEELAQEPKLMNPLAKQGYLNLTQVRTLEDGTKAIFKHDAFSIDPSARNEAAAYKFMENLLSSDAVPPSLLVKETVWNETVLEEAKYKYSGERSRPEKLDHLTMDDMSEGVVQGKVEGGTLARLGFDGLSTDLEAFDRLMSITAFDLVAGNWDRHSKNIMFDEDGLPNAIDNGAGFHYDKMSPDQYYVHESLEELLDYARSLDEDMLKEAAKNVRKRLQSIKRKDLDETLGELLNEDTIRTVARRIPKVIDKIMDYAFVE